MDLCYICKLSSTCQSRKQKSDIEHTWEEAGEWILIEVGQCSKFKLSEDHSWTH